jgi:hypothetical protein
MMCVPDTVPFPIAMAVVAVFAVVVNLAIIGLLTLLRSRGSNA